MEIFVIVLSEKSVKEQHRSVKSHINSIVHKFHSIQFEKIEKIQPLKVDPEPEMSHDFPKDYFLNKIYNHVQLADLKARIQMLKELKEMPALIVPFKFIVDLIDHLFFVKREVLVRDKSFKKSEMIRKVL